MTSKECFLRCSLSSISLNIAHKPNINQYPIIYLIKGSNENTKTGCEICSKLTTKTVEQ